MEGRVTAMENENRELRQVFKAEIDAKWVEKKAEIMEVFRKKWKMIVGGYATGHLSVDTRESKRTTAENESKRLEELVADMRKRVEEESGYMPLVDLDRLKSETSQVLSKEPHRLLRMQVAIEETKEALLEADKIRRSEMEKLEKKPRL